jgi:two-component system chemotaxis response regulator CheY
MMNNIKALVVDDSITIRKIIRANLNKLGISNVYEAPNGDEGFKAAKITRLDVIFIDYNMPGGMSGLELAEKIKADPKISGVKLVAVSSEFDDMLMDQFRRVGVSEFIEKPFDLAKFNSAIVPIIEKAANEEEISGKHGGAKMTKDIIARLFSATPQVIIDDKYLSFVFGKEKVTIPAETFIENAFHFIDIPLE